MSGGRSASMFEDEEQGERGIGVGPGMTGRGGREACVVCVCCSMSRSCSLYCSLRFSGSSGLLIW